MQEWIYKFIKNNTDGDQSMRDLLGGKGANLAQMCKLGIPVPAGFTLSTKVCNYYYENQKEFPENLSLEVDKAIKAIEQEMQAEFGSTENPLLLSVRSGARASMPGMMDTILNLGLNDETVIALAHKTNNPRFAYDSYRRFIAMYSDVVLNIEHSYFEEILENKKLEKNIIHDYELEVEDLKKIVEDYKICINKHHNCDFPNDVREQLWGAIRAVCDSWMSPRAVTYRGLHQIPQQWGTAINIQAMVFGNKSHNSATGVLFTRNPANGEKELYGEYMLNAQGEDVVAGIRTPAQITEAGKLKNNTDDPTMEVTMPEMFRQLSTLSNDLERHYLDMQDIEFTIEEGKLWLLQTRNAKRTARAAVKIAVDLVREKLLTIPQALMRVEALSLDQLLHPTIDTSVKYDIFTKGLPASPGAVSGAVMFSASEAERNKELQKVILVRTETSPEDIHGMIAAEGILTSRGGMTSHAAVVARGMGKACVCGASNMFIDYEQGIMKVGDKIIKEGEIITINGGTGEVIIGEVKTIEPEFSDDFKMIISWADGIRRLKIRANAETEEDATIAYKFGAEGIGLCRTEHMFFTQNRILSMREMIMAASREGRVNALDKLLPMQRDDFVKLFHIMNGLPITIRLLDPPLHEFLPHTEHDIQEVSKVLDVSVQELKHRLNILKEANPMLGHRGCRLAISYPEIYQMQARAIFEAVSIIHNKDSKIIAPEIMIPFVINSKEIKIIKDIISHVRQEVTEEYGVEINYTIGTMIELPRAALKAADIAQHAEFFSFGTNDLTQTTCGLSRDDAVRFMQDYKDQQIFAIDPFVEVDREGVGELMKIAVERGRSTREDLKLGICGEHGGNPNSIMFFDSIGLDYVSCSPYRVPIAKLAAAQAHIINNNG